MKCGSCGIVVFTPRFVCAMCRQWRQEVENGEVKRADGLARFICDVARAKPRSDEIYDGAEPFL